MNKISWMQGLVLGSVLLAAQMGSVQGAECVEEPDVDTFSVQIAEADNELGKQVMAELAKKGENVFISPYSIATALSLLNHCSEEGEQIEELRTFLGYDSMTEEQLLEGQKALMEELSPDFGLNLQEDEKAEWGIGSVEIGNALYVDDQLELAEGFDSLSELLSAYEAEIGAKDLSTEQTMEEINMWVKEKTHELIPSILNEPLSEDMAMILMNTVYFTGDWASTFNEDSTDIQTFHGIKGDTEISMMHQQERFSYAETDGYQIICLPYRYGYAMYVYLPKDREDYKNWSDAEYLRELTGQEYEFAAKEILLSMPKFELGYSVSLVDSLEQLGLTKIFDKGLYDRISRQEIAVSDILHKTALKNDETGTEAAAVTAILCETAAFIEPETPIEMNIDRPFYFTITHNRSGLNLFEGCVVELD